MTDQSIIDLILQWISIPYLLAFMFLSYSFFKLIKNKKIELWKYTIETEHLVFFFAFIVAIPFYFLLEGSNNVVLMKLIITYGIGTSLYELLIKYIIHKIEGKTKIDE